MQESLFDRPRSTAAREDAIQRVEDAADAEWREAAHRACYAVCCALRELTSDDVIAEMERTGAGQPREPRAYGPVMRAMVSAGWAEPTGGFIQSDKVSCHRRPKRVYRSLILKHDAPQPQGVS